MRLMASVAGLVDAGVDGAVAHGVGEVVGVLALVAHHDLQALVEEGHLADPVGDRLEVVGRGLEDVLRGPPGDGGAGALAVLHRTDLLELAVGHAEGERLAPQVAAVADLGVQVGGERVDDRDADAVQAAGDLVAAATELAARVQHGQRHRQRGHLLPGRGVGGDAAAVVLDPHAAVALQGDDDPVAVAGHGLVHRVVDDLPDEVVQPALTGGTDVHAGSLADRFEALQHLDRRGVVVDAVGPLVSGSVAHAYLICSFDRGGRDIGEGRD